MWSRREKKNANAPSVYATINQFNAVSYRVIATVLKHPDLHQEDRAAIIEKWIDIAHVGLYCKIDLNEIMINIRVFEKNKSRHGSLAASMLKSLYLCI